MDRITRRIGTSIDFVGGKGYANLPHKEGVRLLFEKLAEYEDIGMTPDEIKLFLKDFGISQAIKIRELKRQQEEDEEIISKMAKRLKAFEGNIFNMDWIPVSERLPNDEECSKFDNLHPLSRKFLCTIKIGDFNPEPRLLFYSKVFGWKYGADDYNEYVVAWQPLPEPYKEVSK